MVDTSSSKKILFYSAFCKMNLKKSNLEPYSSSLVSFDSHSTPTKGKIKLPISLKSVTLMVDFLVVNAPSPYNAILGKGWIHKMKAVPLTYHQCLWFLTLEGLMEVHGNQELSRKCYALAMKSEQHHTPPYQ